jgi:hypothetical protein
MGIPVLRPFRRPVSMAARTLSISRSAHSDIAPKRLLTSENRGGIRMRTGVRLQNLNLPVSLANSLGLKLIGRAQEEAYVCHPAE